MPLAPIAPEAFEKIAVGIDRPEDVVVGPDGRVFASDHQCAVAEIFPDGAFKRLYEESWARSQVYAQGAPAAAASAAPRRAP